MDEKETVEYQDGFRDGIAFAVEQIQRYAIQMVKDFEELKEIMDHHFGGP